MLDEALLRTLEEHREGAICVLSGAGISAESGIPTFRGKDGYWTLGSRNYMPEEMATARMFAHAPEEVWRWYLSRFGVFRQFSPNAAHFALVDLESRFGERFALVTQNIDGLHRRAGSSVERTYCIHGDGAFVRCANECGTGLLPLPDLGLRDAQTSLSEHEKAALHCPSCGGWLRPHVLWFDEYYDEPLYRAESAMRAAARSDLLLVVGTSGATNLPMQIGDVCLRLGSVIVDVNPEPNPFTLLAARARRGHFAKGSATDLVPRIVQALLGGG
jgi:NAD-dependent deacetylase